MKFNTIKTDAHVFTVIDMSIDSGLDLLRTRTSYSCLVVCFGRFFQKIFLR